MDFDDPLVQQRSTLVPYYFCGIKILHRLLWDIHPQSWTSRKKIRKWKDRYAGKKAIIVCNGPSLNKLDFNLIEPNIFTFGLNKINLLFDRSSFRPSCIVAVNRFVIEQNNDFYNTTNIPLFLDSIGITNNLIIPRKNIIFLQSSAPSEGFAKDCSISINQGYTVTYVALQLAFHMGFNKVGLVGADHTFATKGPANKTVDGETEDLSHFDSRYFANMKWQLPDLFESEVAYKRADNMYKSHDKKIFNCTDGGKLEIFDRMPLSDFLLLP